MCRGARRGEQGVHRDDPLSLDAGSCAPGRRPGRHGQRAWPLRALRRLGLANGQLRPSAVQYAMSSRSLPRRCERLLAAGLVDEAAALVLTNEPRIWAAPGRRPASFDSFRLDEGRDVTGVLDWGPAASPGTRGGRDALTVTGHYRLRWRTYSTVDGHPFRYLPILSRAAAGPVG